VAGLVRTKTIAWLAQQVVFAIWHLPQQLKLLALQDFTANHAQFMSLNIPVLLVLMYLGLDLLLRVAPHRVQELTTEKAPQVETPICVEQQVIYV
jgi:hypothetical protein